MIALAIALVCLALSLVLSLVVSRHYPQLSAVAAGLGLCLASVYLAITLLAIPFGSGTDEVVYHSQASGVSLSLFLTGDVTSQYASLDQGKYGWPTVLGVLYWLGGTTSPYLGVFVNANITFMALLLTAAAGQRLYPSTEPGPWHVAMLVGSPTVLVFGASLLREPWAWLSIALCIHAVLCALRGRKLLAIGLFLVADGLALWVRTPLAVIIAATFVGAVLIATIYRRWGLKIACFVLIGSSILGLQVLVPLLAAAGYSPSLLLEARDYLATVSTTGFVSRDPFTMVGMFEALVRVGLGPLPWEYGPAFVWAWVLANHLYWLAVLVVVGVVLKRHGPDVARVALLTLSTLLLAGIAIGLTNYGIVVRMRATLIIAVVPLAWGGLPRARRRASQQEPP